MPVHPYIQKVIEKAYKQGHANLPDMTVEEVREYYKKHNVPHKENIQFTEHSVNGTLLRMHYPSNHQSANHFPLIIYFRARAFVLGNLDDSNWMCHELANYLQCAVAAVEPRLSPEHKFPIPFNDAVNFVHYLHEHSHELRIDPKRFAVWGESSGGNFAASISHFFSHQKEYAIAHQVLFYPDLDLSSKQYPSTMEFGEGYLMDERFCAWIASQYCDVAHLSDPRLAPLVSEIGPFYPNTLLIGAECDPLRDESFEYVDKLIQHGIDVEALYFPGMVHGFVWFNRRLDVALNALLHAVDYLKARWSLKTQNIDSNLKREAI